MNVRTRYYDSPKMLLKSSSPRPNRRNDEKKLDLAQAGKDLFLAGFVDDAITRTHVEARHPAVAPNLGAIPEGRPMLHEDSLGKFYPTLKY